ncbi:MAG: isocitrate/isopropylmalate family dehydrogenase [Chitinophagaceae bacterium]
MVKTISVIPGDGIGPEVTEQSIKVLNAVAERFDHEFNYTYCLMGADAIDKTGNPLPDETIEVLFEQRCHFIWSHRSIQNMIMILRRK